jgi:hypothetical protein
LGNEWPKSFYADKEPRPSSRVRARNFDVGSKRAFKLKRIIVRLSKVADETSTPSFDLETLGW